MHLFPHESSLVPRRIQELNRQMVFALHLISKLIRSDSIYFVLIHVLLCSRRTLAAFEELGGWKLQDYGECASYRSFDVKPGASLPRFLTISRGR